MLFLGFGPTQLSPFFPAPHSHSHFATYSVDLSWRDQTYIINLQPKSKMNYGFRIQFVCCVFAVVLCFVSAKWQYSTMNAANYTRCTIYISPATGTQHWHWYINTHTVVKIYKYDGFGGFRFVVLCFRDSWFVWLLYYSYLWTFNCLFVCFLSFSFLFFVAILI